MSSRHCNISTMWINVLLSNYGTFFQHYALRKILRDIGFVPSRYLAGRSKFVGARVAWYFARKLLAHPNEITNQLNELICYFSFKRDYLRLIGAVHEQCTFGDDDICIVGSDQILSPNPFDWFSYENPKCRRIVYAGSCDWVRQSTNPSWHNTVRKELPKFAAVGVREEIGVEACRKYVSDGVMVSRVQDPVFLLTQDEWRSVTPAQTVFDKPTLLVYLVNLRKDYRVDCELLEELARRLGCTLKIVGLQGSARYLSRKDCILLSPTEFLAALRDATYFITNSFHGTALALIFKKPFVTIGQVNLPGFNFNTRQQELLARLGLTERLVSCLNIDEVVEKLRERVDHERVDAILLEDRNRSLEWLKEAING